MLRTSLRVARNRVSLRSQAGLTLIEVMVAMMIFTVVATGVAGTLTIGLSSTVDARLSTLGEQATRQQIEAMRAMAYYVPYSSDPSVGTTNDVDLLDYYYPGINTSHHTDNQGWTGWYAQSGTDAYYTRVSPPDSHGITTTVETRFVDNSGNVIIPLSTYSSNAANADRPPSNLVSIHVTSSWQYKGQQKSYSQDSDISATAHSPSTAGGGGSDSGSGCLHASNSTMDVTGVGLTTSVGVNLLDILDTDLQANGKIGNAKSATTYGCETTLSASGTANQLTLAGITTLQGANASVTGPPDASQTSGPFTVSTPSGWPSLSIGSSASAQVASDPGTGGPEAKAFGDSADSLVSLGLSQLNTSQSLLSGLLGSLLGTKTWSIANPAVQVTNGPGTPATSAHLDQENGVTTAAGSVHWPQINILPMTSFSLLGIKLGPDASQGLIFVRNFTASGVNGAPLAQANGAPGGASASLTYSATIGLFNPNASTGCTGDNCYVIYSVDPQHPLQDLLNVINSDNRFVLQRTLIPQLSSGFSGEFSSATQNDINNGLFWSYDGTQAKVSIDALMKLQVGFGAAVELNTNNLKVSILSLDLSNSLPLLTNLLNDTTELKGLIQVNIGQFNVSVQQNQ